MGLAAAACAAAGIAGAARAETTTTNGVTWTYYVFDREASVAGAVPATGQFFIPSRLGGYPVTSIGQGAFAGEEMTSVVIPNSVVTIGASAFDTCTNLSSVNLGNGVKTIGSNAFHSCRILSVTIPDSVTDIGEMAFWRCGRLQELTLGANVTNIGYRAFCSCGLTELNLPDSVRNIGATAFYWCTQLRSANLGNHLENIGDWAFSMDYLESVSIPKSVTNIGARAFYWCISLKTVALHEGLVSIGESAFDSCPELKKLTIPTTVQRVETNAFDNSGLQELRVPLSWADTDMLDGTGVPTNCLVIYYGQLPVLRTVWRFYSKKYKGHFYTISDEEKDALIATNPNWNFEGEAYRAYTNWMPGLATLHRFYSKKYQGHFYTIDEAEKDDVIENNPNWNYEGVAYYVYPEEVSGSAPVYRFWSKKYKHHFYTIDEAEKDDLVANNPNWTYERIAFWALPLAGGGGKGKAAKGMEAAGMEQVMEGDAGDGAREEAASQAGRLRNLGARAARPRVAVTTCDGTDGSAVADGDEGTRWSPEADGAGWVALAFAEPMEVGSVEVVGGNLPDGLRVLWSENAETWEEEEPGAAKYVWVTWDAGAAEGNPMVKEIRVGPPL